MSFWTDLLKIFGKSSKPKPTPILPKPPMPLDDIRIHATIVNPTAQLPVLEVEQTDPPIIVTGVLDKLDGRITFTLPPHTPPHGYVVTWPGNSYRPSVTVPGNGDSEFPGPTLAYTPPKPTSAILPALQQRGQFYYQADGTPFTVKMCSAFLLYQRWLAGDDIRPTLADWQDIGFNTARVWLLNTSVGHIVPSEHGSRFYEELPTFLGVLGAYGLYAELTLFTQTTTLMPKLEDQQRHYDFTVTAIGSIFCFIEGGNEIDAHDNDFDHALKFWKPEGATFDVCFGSYGSDAWVRTGDPVLDSTRYHSNDANEWWRRQAHNGMEIADSFKRPNIANENTRPDHDRNPIHHRDAAAGAALLSAGSCFHSTTGKNATVFTDAVDRACALAFCQGANSVDLTQRTSGYIHRVDLEQQNKMLRVYQRGTAIVEIGY